MARKKDTWFNMYYLLIILICLMVGFVIWFLFSLKLSELEPENKEAGHKEQKTAK